MALLSVFRVSVETFSPRPPFHVICRWFSLTSFVMCPLRIGLLSVLFCLAFPVGFVSSPFRGVRGVLRSRIFASCSSSWNRVLHEFSHISAYTAHQSGPVQWFSWDNLDKAGYHLPHMYWDRLCITWEAYRRRETREFRARHEPRFSLPSCQKKKNC